MDAVLSVVASGSGSVSSAAIAAAAGGGLCGGTYTIFIKTERAAAANPHPLAWTIYKCFWLFVFGCVLVLNRAIQQLQPVYVFSWWGILAAVFWVPASLFMNAAVPRCGVAMASTIESGTVSVLSFIIGWAALQEEMKSVIFPPLIMALILAGIAMLVSAPHLCLPKDIDEVPKTELGNNGRQDAAESPRDCGPGTGAGSQLLNRSLLSVSSINPHMPAPGCQLAGVLFGVLSGCSAALQVGMVNIGRKVEKSRPGGCDCDCMEQFSDFGSWLLSFGIGGVIMTSIAWVLFSAANRRKGEPPVSIHFKQMGPAGSAMGFLWCVQTLLVTEAVTLGGSAVMTPAAKAIQIITAGLWGILYYKENSGWRAGVWCAAAVWTIVFMTLLGLQRVRSKGETPCPGQ